MTRPTSILAVAVMIAVIMVQPAAVMRIQSAANVTVIAKVVVNVSASANANVNLIPAISIKAVTPVARQSPQRLVAANPMDKV